jgi:hypothetical protein
MTESSLVVGTCKKAYLKVNMVSPATVTSVPNRSHYGMAGSLNGKINDY